MLMNFICTYTIYMSEFLAQLTDPLTKSISTILRQRKRGKVGNGKWGREWGSRENACIMSEIVY